ncbi:MAG TPA: MBL fold metallo-hydrolase [Blastocatellia bacterium]|nr:MBL fold metallo-hydrolase [Blastocatellia bacterium]
MYDVAAREARITQIDHLITTHFHRDHFGGILALSKVMPIKTFYGHGTMTDLAEDPGFKDLYADYQAATAIGVPTRPGRHSIGSIK